MHNPDLMPANMSEWNELVDLTLAKDQARYDAACAEARAEAAALFDARKPAIMKELEELAREKINAMTAQTEDGSRPLSEEEKAELLLAAMQAIGPQLEEQKTKAMNEAAMQVEPPISRAEVESAFACYRPQENQPGHFPPDTPADPIVYRLDSLYYDVSSQQYIPEEETTGRRVIPLSPPTRDNLITTLQFYHYPVGNCLLTQEQKIQKFRTEIDQETSSRILAGFEYTLEGATYHFSYDEFDQQNFADTANACILKKSGQPGLPDAVTWNAYDPDTGSLTRLALTPEQFLDLYLNGALTHKAACMETGGVKKAEVEAAHCASQDAAQTNAEQPAQ